MIRGMESTSTLYQDVLFSRQILITISGDLAVAAPIPQAQVHIRDC